MVVVVELGAVVLTEDRWPVTDGKPVGPRSDLLALDPLHWAANTEASARIAAVAAMPNVSQGRGSRRRISRGTSAGVAGVPPAPDGPSLSGALAIAPPNICSFAATSVPLPHPEDRDPCPIDRPSERDDVAIMNAGLSEPSNLTYLDR
jgi:hypothetical protein